MKKRGKNILFFKVSFFRIEIRNEGKKGTEKSRGTFNNREKERKEEEEIKKKQEKKLNFSTRKKVLTFHYCSQIIIEPHNALLLEAISGKSQQRCLFQTRGKVRECSGRSLCLFVSTYLDILHSCRYLLPT